MASKTLLQLRTDLRVMMNDGGSNPIWEDTDLNLCIADAIVAWSSEMPFGSSSVESVVSGQTEYDLPTGCVTVSRVRATVDGKLRWLTPVDDEDMEGGYWTPGQEPTGYVAMFPLETQIYFPRAPEGDDYTLYYGVARVEPVDDTDSTDFANRAWGPLAVRHLAGFYAFNPASAFRAQLEQWASRLDLKVDNPLEQEANRWLREYRRLMLTYGQITGVAY